MSRAIPPLPNAVTVWCLVKHRENFTCILPIMDNAQSEVYHNYTIGNMRTVPILCIIMGWTTRVRFKQGLGYFS